jgi:hypothetical protein
MAIFLGVNVLNYIILSINPFRDKNVTPDLILLYVKSHESNGIIPLYNIYSTYIEIRLVETIPRDNYQNIVFPLFEILKI